MGRHVRVRNAPLTSLTIGSTRLQILVALDPAPARRADLHEREPARVLRVALEEPTDGAKALGEALRVVDPLHPHPEALHGQRPSPASTSSRLGAARRPSRERR